MLSAARCSAACGSALLRVHESQPARLPCPALPLQFLKAVRLRVEMRWAAAERQRRCDCPPVDLEAGDKCCQPSSSQPSSSRLDEAAAAKPPCCGGSGDAGDGGEAASSSASDSVPTSSRRKYWLRGAATSERALVVGGYQLITRAQAAKNLWRSCFTFVVIFLDYGEQLSMG